MASRIGFSSSKQVPFILRAPGESKCGSGISAVDQEEYENEVEPMLWSIEI
jgi:hypothetical protein